MSEKCTNKRCPATHEHPLAWCDHQAQQALSEARSWARAWKERARYYRWDADHSASVAREQQQRAEAENQKLRAIAEAARRVTEETFVNRAGILCRLAQTNVSVGQLDVALAELDRALELQKEQNDDTSGGYVAEKDTKRSFREIRQSVQAIIEREPTEEQLAELRRVFSEEDKE